MKYFISAGLAVAAISVSSPASLEAQSAVPKLSYHDTNYYFAEGGDVTLSLRDLRPGGVASASLCIEGDGRPHDNCRNVLSWDGDWRIPVRAGWHITIWVAEPRRGGPNAPAPASRDGVDGPTGVARFRHADFAVDIHTN